MSDSVNGHWPIKSEDWMRNGSPSTMFRESLPRWACGSDLAIAASGVELAVAVPLQAGDVVTNITFVTGATAANGPTAGYACLRTAAGALIAQTADFGSTARAANTAYTVALGTGAPYLVTAPGIFLVGISLTVSTTMPTLSGATLRNGIMAGAIGSLGGVVLSKSHGSAVGATAPATVATPTTTFAIPYLILT